MVSRRCVGSMGSADVFVGGVLYTRSAGPWDGLLMVRVRAEREVAASPRLAFSVN